VTAFRLPSDYSQISLLGQTDNERSATHRENILTCVVIVLHTLSIVNGLFHKRSQKKM